MAYTRRMSTIPDAPLFEDCYAEGEPVLNCAHVHDEDACWTTTETWTCTPRIKTEEPEIEAIPDAVQVFLDTAAELLRLFIPKNVVHEKSKKWSKHA